MDPSLPDIPEENNGSEDRADSSALEECKAVFRLAALASRDIIYDWILEESPSTPIEDEEEAAALELLGETFLSEIRRRPSLIHQDDRAEVLESLDRTLKGTENCWIREYRVLFPDGDYRMVRDRGYIIRDPKGLARRIVGALSPVVPSTEEIQATEIKSATLGDAATKPLEFSTENLQRLATVGLLTAEVAHELGGPLSAIINFTEIAKRAGDDNPELRQEAIEVIRSEAQRCSRLVSNVLQSAQRTDTVPIATDLSELVERMQMLVEKKAQVAGIRFTTNLPDNLPAVAVHPDEIVQLLLNLTINAIDACQSDDEITVTLATDDDTITIVVADTGCGIPPEQQEKIFEPFYTTKSDQGGTGLGMSVCSDIVARHGGILDLESSPQQGTTVTIRLPREPA